jgi:Rieske 2Fe-2S family protein
MNTQREGISLHDLISRQRSGFSLEQPFYTAPQIFQIDMDRIFRRYWLYAGHISQVTNPGDYFTFEIGSESLIVTRGQDDRIHALFNMCRHRGARICRENSGNARRLVCQYHHWVYDSDGTLLSARLMPEDFDRSQYGLHRAHVRLVEGMIFVCLADEAPEFDVVARDFERMLRPHGLLDAKVCHTRHYQIRANWKIIGENFSECYHCGPGHPEYCQIVGYALAGDSQRGADDEAQRQAQGEARWKAKGLHVGVMPWQAESIHICRRRPLLGDFVSQSLDGRPAAPLMGTLPDWDAGLVTAMTRPNFYLEMTSDHAWITHMKPKSTTVTEMEVNWLVRQDAVEGVDYDVDRLTALWKITAEQDWTICESNQAGVESCRYEPGPFAPCESQIETFKNWYLREIRGSGADPHHGCQDGVHRDSCRGHERNGSGGEAGRS